MILRAGRYSLYLLALSSVVIFALTFSYNKDITIPSNVTGKHIEVNGLKLRVYQTGEGPDVLFIHASIGNLEDFEAVQPYLKGYRITLFDRIGHGYSAMPTVKANINNNARYVSDLITTLQLKNVIVVGHSYGGSIALKMALNKDPNIQSLLLLAPAGYSLTPTSKLEHLLAKPVIGLGLLRILQPFMAKTRLRRGLLDSVIPNQSLLPAEFITKRIGLWNNPGILFTRAQQTNDVTAELNTMQQQYPEIEIPVTILLGDKEPHQDIVQGSLLLNKIIKHSNLIFIENGGHYLQYKNPVLISHAIKAAALK